MKKPCLLVDSQDNPIGETDLLDAHRGEGKLHRAISVYLFRKNPANSKKIQLLIQQRSDQKIVGANQWANTVCGNLRPWEEYIDCALRRLKEELGLIGFAESDLIKIDKFQYQVKCNEEFSENEIDQAFASWWQPDMTSNMQENPEEVRQTKWVSWEKIKSWQDKTKTPSDLDLAPWFEIMLHKPELIKKLDIFLQNS